MTLMGRLTCWHAYFGAALGRLRRCGGCGARPVYSWGSRWLPIGPLCERCTELPEVKR